MGLLTQDIHFYMRLITNQFKMPFCLQKIKFDLKSNTHKLSHNDTSNAKIFCRILRGIKFRVAFSIESQWSVSRENG